MNNNSYKINYNKKGGSKDIDIFQEIADARIEAKKFEDTSYYEGFCPKAFLVFFDELYSSYEQINTLNKKLYKLKFKSPLARTNFWKANKIEDIIEYIEEKCIIVNGLFKYNLIHPQQEIAKRSHLYITSDDSKDVINITDVEETFIKFFYTL